jgi:putative transposase
MVGTLRRELLDHLLIRNESHLRAALTEYTARYDTARPHQGINQRVPDHSSQMPTATIIDVDTARVRRRPVLGGVTSEYHVAA